MKIGLGGFHIESCTFSPLLSCEEDFTILRGQDLLESYPFLASFPDVVPAPLARARALPGGPVEAGFYAKFKQEFLQQLVEAAPLDGLFLHMHGAVSVAGLEDAEGDLLTAVRGVVGEGCVIAASYDLHGNVSGRVVEALDFLTAYRTAPHVDWYETVERAFSTFVKCVSERRIPYKAFIPVPILLPGEKTSTEWEPAASLYRSIPAVIDGDAVMDASILIGYAWADEPRSTACVVAYGMDRVKVHAAAAQLGQRFWDARNQFRFGVEAAEVDDCIRIALTAPERPVVISDSGDNPTAGGAGDTPFVLERLLALGAADVVVASVADRDAVTKCEMSGVGAMVDLSLGGKLDPVHASPLAVRGQVRSLHIFPWTLSPSKKEEIHNHLAVVDVQGIQIIITSLRTPFHRIQDFTNLGIDPHGSKIVVVKIGYLEPELKKLAAKALLALSPGAVNQAIEKLEYRRIRRPMFPFDVDFDWAPPEMV